MRIVNCAIIIARTLLAQAPHYFAGGGAEAALLIDFIKLSVSASVASLLSAFFAGFLLFFSPSDDLLRGPNPKKP